MILLGSGLYFDQHNNQGSEAEQSDHECGNCTAGHAAATFAVFATGWVQTSHFSLVKPSCHEVIRGEPFVQEIGDAVAVLPEVSNGEI